MKNYTLFTKDGKTYLIWNEPQGDNSYIQDFDIPAGDFLNGFDLSANLGQELIVEKKHFTNTYNSITAGDALTIADAYKVGSPVVVLKVVEKCKLGGNDAVVAVVANPS